MKTLKTAFTVPNKIQHLCANHTKEMHAKIKKKKTCHGNCLSNEPRTFSILVHFSFLWLFQYYAYL